MTKDTIETAAFEFQASESAAEKACASLKKIIEAAENSNQAGENAAVIAAAGGLMYRALTDIAQGNMNATDEMLVSKEALQTALALYCQRTARDVIAKVQSWR